MTSASLLPSPKLHPSTTADDFEGTPAASTPVDAAKTSPDQPSLADLLPFATESTQMPTLAGPVATDTAVISEAMPLTDQNSPPIYPRLAKERGWQGLVLLQVQVSSEGRVQALWVEASSGYDLLDQAALAAVRQWHFQPAQQDGRALAGRVRVPIAFELRGR
jgi:protein TonB